MSKFFVSKIKLSMRDYCAYCHAIWSTAENFTTLNLVPAAEVAVHPVSMATASNLEDIN